MEKFAAGLMLGAVAGPLIVTNNCKARMLVKKSQDDVLDKVNEMLDERLDCLEAGEHDKHTKKQKA